MTAAERRWCWSWAALVMALTTAPYVWAWLQTPPGREFCWVLSGRDDHAAYMAWMRQAAEGSFLFRNLFTTDPQSGHLSNSFFWLLGQPVRFLGASPALMLHAARLLCGALLLVLVYRFAAYFTQSMIARRTTFWLAALSAGVGWGDGFGWYHALRSLPAGEAVLRLPTDIWQPEAFTFLSIYTTALFAASTCAVVGILCLLLEAERTGKRRHALWAGALALLLGNFHSYDILHVAAAWAVYLLLKTGTQLARGEGAPWRSWGDALACALIGLPTTLLQYAVYRTDPVFRQRADFETLSPHFSAYALGYGLVLLLALPGAVLLLRGQPGSTLKLSQRWMPVAWAVAGFGVAYLPLAFNRKMIMGTHVPLCLLAGMALAALAERAFLRSGTARGHRAVGWRFGLAPVIALVVLLTAPSNLLFVLRDLQDAGDRPQDLNWFSAYWPQTDIEAMAWIRRNTPRDAAFFCTPTSGRYIAAAAGRAVYVGHWGETPRFNERFPATYEFFSKPLSPEERRLRLKESATQYLYQGTTERRAGALDLSQVPGLEKLYDTDGVTIYRVREAGVTP